ncbi:helix-turn-helix transcriptional regulator [Haladaptatus pallidirubidus]|uniref:Methanogenesis regulatory protein FilR1 middle domain-containing protein n=1 Tax=Haladaptatus pallidirubidus TaxID=1008152 RepID=A0AAV3UJ63_9EURY|nr:transcriptional regulator FilR1 domain-containing protein [Haladaptatus pallidirubidus]
MSNHLPLTDTILRSNARTAILVAIAGGCDSTRSLVDSDLASESAVYNALTCLQEQGLIRKSRSKRWSLTGLGQVAADYIGSCQQSESVLSIDPDYWQTHDVTALPPRFRLRLSELAGGEVVKATETRPTNAIYEVEQRLVDANSISAITPVYNDQLADAASDADITRLIFDEAVFDEVITEMVYAQPSAKEMIRVTDVSVAITVTDDCLLLSLPTLDGTYDSQTEFIADTDEARSWGKHLLEFYWESAQPPEYDSSRHN